MVGGVEPEVTGAIARLKIPAVELHVEDGEERVGV
jgi:hypothetical protein